MCNAILECSKVCQLFYISFCIFRPILFSLYWIPVRALSCFIIPLAMQYVLQSVEQSNPFLCWTRQNCSVLEIFLTSPSFAINQYTDTCPSCHLSEAENTRLSIWLQTGARYSSSRKANALERANDEWTRSDLVPFIRKTLGF